MWKELEANYFLLSAFLCLWTFLDEYNHCCNSETREDSLRSYPECEGFHGGRTSRLRIRILSSSLSLYHLQLRKRPQKQHRTLESLKSNLGGGVLEKLRERPQMRGLGGPDLSSPWPTSSRVCWRHFWSHSPSFWPCMFTSLPPS